MFHLAALCIKNKASCLLISKWLVSQSGYCPSSRGSNGLLSKLDWSAIWYARVADMTIDLKQKGPISGIINCCINREYLFKVPIKITLVCNYQCTG